MKPIDVTVVIVSYNVKYFTEQTLHSVLRSEGNLSLEIIVVDNNSSDKTIDYLKPLFPGVLFIANKENLGFSKANNMAIIQAKGNYILLLNPDTIVAEDTLIKSVNFLRKHPEAGAVGTKMITYNGSFLPESKRGRPTVWNSFTKIFGLSKLFPNSKLFGKYHLRYLDKGEVHEVDVLSGAFMMIPRTTIDKVGLLDEQFFMYGEDIDYSYRIQLSGLKNFYLPNTILHYKGESTHESETRYVEVFHQAMELFYKKHYGTNSSLICNLVKMGINVSALMTLIRRCWPNKTKKTNDYGTVVFANKNCDCLNKTFPNKEMTFLMPDLDMWKNTRHSVNDMVFSVDEIGSYKQMLSFMENHAEKDRKYHFLYVNKNLLVLP